VDCQSKKKTNVEFQNSPRKAIGNSKGEVVLKEFFLRKV